MVERKEIKELSEWLTNLIRANESPDLPDWARKRAEVLVYTCGGNDAYLSALTDNEKNRYKQLDFIQYVSARAWASDGSTYPNAISVKEFLVKSLLLF